MKSLLNVTLNVSPSVINPWFTKFSELREYKDFSQELATRNVLYGPWIRETICERSPPQILPDDMWESREKTIKWDTTRGVQIWCIIKKRKLKKCHKIDI